MNDPYSLKLRNVTTGSGREFVYDVDGKRLWVTTFDAKGSAVGKGHWVTTNPIPAIRAEVLRVGEVDLDIGDFLG